MKELKEIKNRVILGINEDGSYYFSLIMAMFPTYNNLGRWTLYHSSIVISNDFINYNDTFLQRDGQQYRYFK